LINQLVLFLYPLSLGIKLSHMEHMQMHQSDLCVSSELDQFSNSQ